MAAAPCDAIALGLAAISCLVFYVKQGLPLLADGVPANTHDAAGLSAGSSSSAAPAAAWEGPLLLAAAAAAPLLLVLSFSPQWPRWRRWAVPGVRLVLFPALPWLAPLEVAPSCVAVDAARVILGSRTYRLLFFGLALPLDLPAHLAVHTLCLALALVDAPGACTLPVLSGTQPAARIAAAHRLIGTLGTGGLLQYFPPNNRQVQCVAALNTSCIFIGWLVPTYFALRRHHEAAQHRRQQQRQQQRLGQQQAGMARGMAPAPAGVDQPADAIGCPTGSAGSVLPPGRRADTAVAWVLDNLFLRNALLPETAALAWWVLAAFCWIAGGLLAVLAVC